MTTNEGAPGPLRAPDPDGHKYDRGHLLVVSGGLEKAGAARLAAGAGLRVGAGLVTVACPAEAAVVHGSGQAALMLEVIAGPEDLAGLVEARKVSACVIGPGLAPDGRSRAMVAALAETGASLLLDAGALSAFAGRLEALKAVCAGAGPVVLTPHGGEFARLFGQMSARAAAQDLGAVVVRKGPRSVVASVRVWEGPPGPAWLATAGTGDVLAGVIGGLLAQGYGAEAAARLGVWLHVRAAQAAGAYMVADDLEPALRGVLMELAAPK